MSAAQKKIRPEISPKSHVQKKRPVAKGKGKRKLPEPRATRSQGWMICGFDVSLSSIAGAAIGYDTALNKLRGPAFTIQRWQTEDHYFDRLKFAAKSHEMVLDLQAGLKFGVRSEEVFISQEEPFPPHGKFMQGGASGFLKQQAEISGAFLGGLLRYGFKELWQLGSITWRKVVADMLFDALGEPVTTHHSKWKSEKLAERFRCNLADSGKFRSKQWALDVMQPFFGQMYEGDEIPDWPDIVRSNQGHKPRPEDSTAKAFQPDDRYDALAILWSLYLDMGARGVLKGIS
jgi:hypothetical protein